MSKFYSGGWTTAQQLYILMGVTPLQLINFNKGKSASYTKKGPGRVPKRGKKKQQQQQHRHTYTINDLL